MLLMDQDLEKQSMGNLKDPMGTKADNGETSNKCSDAGTLQVPSEEKSNKCSQCDFASSRTDVLRRHLKIHIGEKSHKCNQGEYKSSHLKIHSGEK